MNLKVVLISTLACALSAQPWWLWDEPHGDESHADRYNRIIRTLERCQTQCVLRVALGYECSQAFLDCKDRGRGKLSVCISNGLSTGRFPGCYDDQLDQGNTFWTCNMRCRDRIHRWECNSSASHMWDQDLRRCLKQSGT